MPRVRRSGRPSTTQPTISQISRIAVFSPHEFVYSKGAEGRGELASPSSTCWTWANWTSISAATKGWLAIDCGRTWRSGATKPRVGKSDPIQPPMTDDP